MSKGYFAPLVLLPVIITKPGFYQTRGGEKVRITKVSERHDFHCFGYYTNSCADTDCWHKSGRIFATSETANDIVKELPDVQ